MSVLGTDLRSFNAVTPILAERSYSVDWRHCTEMSSSEGDELVKKADKKMKGGFLSKLLSSNREEDAIELYEKAARQYMIEKLCA